MDTLVKKVPFLYIFGAMQVLISEISILVP